MKKVFPKEPSPKTARERADCMLRRAAGGTNLAPSDPADKEEGQAHYDPDEAGQHTISRR